MRAVPCQPPCGTQHDARPSAACMVLFEAGFRSDAIISMGGESRRFFWAVVFLLLSGDLLHGSALGGLLLLGCAPLLPREAVRSGVGSRGSLGLPGSALVGHLQLGCAPLLSQEAERGGVCSLWSLSLLPACDIHLGRPCVPARRPVGGPAGVLPLRDPGFRRSLPLQLCSLDSFVLVFDAYEEEFCSYVPSSSG